MSEEEKLKIGMYTENDYFELFEKHNLLGRSMYDAIFDKIHAQITEIEQLKSDLKQKEKKCSDKDVEYQEKIKLQKRIDRAVELLDNTTILLPTEYADEFANFKRKLRNILKEAI